VDCGEGPEGSSAAFLDSGTILLLDRDLDVVGSPLPAAGAQDVAVGDVGAGPEVRVCSTPGCSIVHFPYGADGSARFAIAEGQQTVLADAAGATTPLAGFGELSVTDVDGDGNLDLAALWGTGDVVTVHRSTGEGIGPAEQWMWETHVVGPVSSADGDGDGSPDLFVLDLGGALSHTLPPTDPGTADPTTPFDTADTGFSPP
jgi:hypothetical protein